MSEPEGAAGIRRFFEVLVRHPIGVLMLSVALLGMAWIAASRIPIELIPSGLSDNSLTVSADWSGAIPSEIEKRILEPLEKELRSVTSLETLWSQASTGNARLYLNFPGNLDMDEVYADVADRIERARPFLPAEVDRVRIFKNDMDGLPIMMAAAIAPEDPTIAALPPEERQAAERIVQERVQDFVADYLAPRLEAVDGVAQVQTWGVEPQSVRILLDPERVYANAVDIGALIGTLSADNQSAPVGDIDDVGSRFLVRVDSRFSSLEQIENFPIRPGLKLKDVGRVVSVRSAPEYLFRVRGNYTVSCAISKETSANTFEICQELKRLFEVEFANDPILGDYEYAVFFNQGEMIGESLKDLVRDALLGGLIACVVLWAFLRRLSYTLLITLSIPFAVLLTLAWLYFTGASLNLFTMIGITISIGMLVDNSVVIVESIFTRRERGADTMSSVTRGPAEVLLAIVTATLTTVVVFLPLIFLTEDRNMKVIAGAIGIPLCVALLAALMLAVVMVPVAARFLQHKGKRSKKRAASAGHLPDWMGRVLDGVTRWTLSHRFTATLLAVAFVASGQVASVGSGFSEGGGGDGQHQISFDFSEGTRLWDAHLEVQEIEHALTAAGIEDDFPDISWGIGFNDDEGEINLWPEKPLNKREVKELMDWMRAELPLRASLEYRFEDDFRRQSERADGWTRIRVEGTDSLGVAKIHDQIRVLAEADPFFTEISKEDPQAREIRVSLDRQQMSRLGVNSETVTSSLEWTLRGFMVSRFATAKQDLPIIIEYDREADPDRSTLEELNVWTGEGVSVPLSTFASFTASRAPTSLWRRDGRIVDTIGLKADTEDVKQAHDRAAALMEQVVIPDGYRWTTAGGWSDLEDQFEQAMKAFALAVILVFLLMGLLFNSLVLPLSVLSTVVFALTGSRWALKLSGMPFGMMEMIGQIVLAGVVVNNGIVLVDRILQHRRRGQERFEAVRMAVRDRTRPVVMTALTTVCGLLPIAVSEPSGDGFSFQGLAIGVSGGIAIATFFTLWAVPLFYTLFDDLGALFSRWFTGRVHSEQAGPSA